MARPKTPEGKRVTICVKVSEAQAAEIDAARGSMDRSEWLRLAALAATERQRPPAARPVPKRIAMMLAGEEFAPPPSRPKSEDCPHPKARINKGLCGACGTNVGTQGAAKVLPLISQE